MLAFLLSFAFLSLLSFYLGLFRALFSFFYLFWLQDLLSRRFDVILSSSGFGLEPSFPLLFFVLFLSFSVCFSLFLLCISLLYLCFLFLHFFAFFACICFFILHFFASSVLYFLIGTPLSFLLPLSFFLSSSFVPLKLFFFSCSSIAGPNCSGAPSMGTVVYRGGRDLK